MPYQWATGWNNAAGLDDIPTQPKSTPIQPGRLRENGEGVMVEDGKGSQRLIWTFITYAQHDANMADIGLDTVRSKKATLRTRVNDDGTFANFNAILTKVEGERSMLGGYANSAVEVTGMVAI